MIYYIIWLLTKIKLIVKIININYNILYWLKIMAYLSRFNYSFLMFLSVLNESHYVRKL
jgi:hypothetical protein